MALPTRATLGRLCETLNEAAGFRFRWTRHGVQVTLPDEPDVWRPLATAELWIVIWLEHAGLTVSLSALRDAATLLASPSGAGSIQEWVTASGPIEDWGFTRALHGRTLLCVWPHAPGAESFYDRAEAAGLALTDHGRRKFKMRLADGRQVRVYAAEMTVDVARALERKPAPHPSSEAATQDGGEGRANV